MKKQITDAKTGITYTLQGDYYLPDLSLPAEEEIPIGVWGQRHAAFLKNHQHSVYNEFLVRGKLQRYLAQIDRDAQEMFDLLLGDNLQGRKDHIAENGYKYLDQLDLS